MKRRSHIIFIALLSLIWITTTGDGLADEQLGTDNLHCPDCNVLLITFDALRADHLSLYGYERQTSPFLAELSEISFVFENAFSQATWTLPSVTSLMTSLYPSEHEIGFNKAYTKLPSSVPMLSEILQKNGFSTGGFVVGGHVSRFFGFDRGFDHYERYSIHNENSLAPQLTTLALEWLKTQNGKKTFTWIHYLDPHAPYSLPDSYAQLFDPDYPDPHHLADIAIFSPEIMQGLSPGDLEHVIALYDAEIRYVDDQIKRIHAYLKEQNLLDNTITVVTSDHGESFQRGVIGHGGLRGMVTGPKLFDELIHVPLIIHYPKISGKRSQAPAELIDIMPTLLTMLRIPVPESVSGIDLLNDPDQTKQLVYARHRNNLSVRSTDFKLIHSYFSKNATRIYDLRNDPREQSPLDPSEFPEITDHLMKASRKRLRLFRKKQSKWPTVSQQLTRTDYPFYATSSIPYESVTSDIVSNDPDLLDPRSWDIAGQWQRRTEGRSGIVRFTLNRSMGFLKQTVRLPPDRHYALIAEAKQAPPNRKNCKCASSAITITVQQADSNTEQNIFEDIFDSREDWRKIAVDLSPFMGTELITQIKSESGGDCQIVCRSTLLVDRFYVAEYKAANSDEMPQTLKDELQALGYIE